MLMINAEINVEHSKHVLKNVYTFYLAIIIGPAWNMDGHQLL